MDKEKVAHDLTLLYMSLYDKEETGIEAEGEFDGRYFNTKNRIIQAMPDEPAADHIKS